MSSGTFNGVPMMFLWPSVFGHRVYDMTNRAPFWPSFCPGHLAERGRWHPRRNLLVTAMNSTGAEDGARRPAKS